MPSALGVRANMRAPGISLVCARIRAAIKQAYKTIFLRRPFREGLAEVEATLAKEHEQVAHMCTFLAGSQRGVMRATQRRTARTRSG